jgi:glycosyltransferase involved in cell wall biosynthesis
LGFDQEAKLVLGCGTTDSRKGPDLFVQVAQAFNQSSQYPVQFVWVGGHGGEDIVKNLESLPNKLRTQTIVTFTGAVTNPLPFMLAADVFLLTSREDPFPLVCLESADCGVPIICFAEAGGMPEFVGSTCGAVVPYLDVEAMTNKLCSFIQNERKSRELGAQARQKVRSQFDVSIKGKDIYELLLSLHESGNGHQYLSIPHPG